MNYVEEIVQRLEPELPSTPVELLRLYALLVLTQGSGVSWEDVHNAWALWAITFAPHHPSIIPFQQLPVEIKVKDEPATIAIVKVAIDLDKEKTKARRGR